MPGTRVDFHLSEEALQDLEAIADWYESQAAWQAAKDVLEKILDAMQGLAAHPQSAPIGTSGYRERVISTIPYRVAYSFDATYRRVTVYAVAHTRRRWPVGLS
jgi:plasmid stabilization system protein ParE